MTNGWLSQSSLGSKNGARTRWAMRQRRKPRSRSWQPWYDHRRRPGSSGCTARSDHAINVKTSGTQRESMKRSPRPIGVYHPYSSAKAANVPATIKIWQARPGPITVRPSAGAADGSCRRPAHPNPAAATASPATPARYRPRGSSSRFHRFSGAAPAAPRGQKGGHAANLAHQAVPQPRTHSFLPGLLPKLLV